MKPQRTGLTGSLSGWKPKKPRSDPFRYVLAEEIPNGSPTVGGSTQLSVLLPVTTLEYVWISLLAKKLLQEEIGATKRLGIGCIVVGVILVGLGS